MKTMICLGVWSVCDMRVVGSWQLLYRTNTFIILLQ